MRLTKSKVAILGLGNIGTDLMFKFLGGRPLRFLSNKNSKKSWKNSHFPPNVSFIGQDSTPYGHLMT